MAHQSVDKPELSVLFALSGRGSILASVSGDICVLSINRVIYIYIKRERAVPLFLVNFVVLLSCVLSIFVFIFFEFCV